MDSRSSPIKLCVDQFTRKALSSRKTTPAAERLADKYGPLLDNFQDVIFIVDKEGHFVFVNKASEQRTGIPADTFIGRHFLELLDSRYHEFAKSGFQKAINGEETVQPIEMARQTASGEMITMEMNWKTLYEKDVPLGLLNVSRDVTARKQAEENLKKARDELELRVKKRTAELQKANDILKKQIEDRIRANEKLKESEEKYRSLFENSSDAILIVDMKTGIILDANRQAEKMTGRSRQKIIGIPQRLLTAEDAESYKHNFLKHIKKDAVVNLEAAIVKKKGGAVPVCISASPINLQGKEVIQSIFRDLSKEKMISDLRGELAARKLINRATAIIANKHHINESNALRLLQRESRKQSRKLKELAQAVISSKFILD